VRELPKDELLDTGESCGDHLLPRSQFAGITGPAATATPVSDAIVIAALDSPGARDGRAERTSVGAEPVIHSGDLRRH
jgi:hypothetical protein